MQTQHPIKEIIDRWPSRRELAEDIDVDIYVVHKWHNREGIPPEYDLRLLDAASRRNIPLLWRELMVARTVPKTKAKQRPDQDGHTSAKLQGAK